MMSAGPKKSRKLSGRAATPNTSLSKKSEIETIEKLLTTAAQLMQREPGLDREAFEYLRRLRVKIRFAKETKPSVLEEESKAEAREKWLDRADKNESPVAFIRRVFGPKLGLFSRPDLKRWDVSLYNALNNWISRHDLPDDFDL